MPSLTTSPEEIFQEIKEKIDTRLKLRVRYACLYGLLGRICAEYAKDLKTEFSGLFSQLYAVCRAAGIDYHDADAFRRRARLVLKEETEATEEAFVEDLSLLCRFVCELYKVELPAMLSSVVSGRTFCGYGKKAGEGRVQRVRAVVVEKIPQGIVCLSESGENVVQMAHLLRTHAVIEEGMSVNLIDVDILREGELSARMVIVDPDYLIDVSALSAAVKPYGNSPLNYLIALFQPREVTLPILLGNAANRFVDDIINSKDIVDKESIYNMSLKYHFKENMLSYACSRESFDRDYFLSLKNTFMHLYQVVLERFSSKDIGIDIKKVLLEPSFLCEALGLRGRLDIMTCDYRNLVELKSGKAEEYLGHARHPRSEHTLQMSLYKEILHYNLGIPRDAIRSFLLYSRYPMLYDERSSAAAIKDILELRNEIVVLERKLREGAWQDILSVLTPDRLNLKGLSTALWTKYCKPSLENILRPLYGMSPIVASYFSHFLTFIEREKYLGKTYDGRPDSGRGFASVWTADLTTKLMTGDVLINLRITDEMGEDGVEALVLSMPNYGDKFVANFNVGEMVQLYERSAKCDNVTTRQLFRGYIEELTRERLIIRFLYKQRNNYLFSRSTFYAIEHDASDSMSNQSVRGLYSLLEATETRRSLLLGLRKPEVMTDGVKLSGKYSDTVAPVILAAKCAKDYFLLVGPPGTGKTSVALRGMVEEFLLDYGKEAEQTALLLMAYTNRAVDEICATLESIGTDYVRIGLQETCNKMFHPHLLQNFMEGADCIKEVRRRLLEVPVVTGTIATMSNHIELFTLRHFVAIIDEASQVLEPQLLGLLSAKSPDGHSGISRFIMIGDHKQLPAVVVQSENRTEVTDPLLWDIGLKNLRNSLFERLHTLAVRRGSKGVTALLDKQGRMHPDICRFVNNHFYGHRLKSVGLPHQKEMLALNFAEGPLEKFVSGTRLGFIDIVPAILSDNNKVNNEEADMAARIVAALSALLRKNDMRFDPELQVGIIVPFRNQIVAVRSALRRYLPGKCDAMTIDTVECFQGSQRDYIIFSTTISQPYQLKILSAPQMVEGNMVDRKLNVALTRARKQFFMIGQANLLSRNVIYRTFIETAQRFEP